MRTTLALVVMITVVACTDGGIATTTSRSASTSTTSAAPTSTLPPVIECPGVGEFDEGGGIADIPGESSDSRNIGRISWETNDQCETFHFDFETSEGAPATTAPGIRVDHLESFQVVRINMSVDGTVVANQLVETNLVERLYVVRSLSGGIFVDLHLARPAAVRASVASSPARLTIDLRPGFVSFTGASSVGENIVLTSPEAGATVDAETMFLGYARTLGENVLAVVTQDDQVVTETSTPTADSIGIWGEYRLELDLPQGPVSVFLGEEGSDTGSLQGITVDLTAN